ncbi:UDP-galactose transporter, partial [Wuchereria bancrofti]
DHETIFNEGMLYGFDMLVWIVVFWYCIGGLSVAVCIKYSGNIAKNFATSAAIIISMVASIYLFGFIPNPLFLLGTGLVITSIFLYSS